MKNKSLVGIILIVVLAVCVLATGCNKPQFVPLDKNNWAPENFERLNALMKEVGTTSKNYDKDNKPYAVFDFDNTSVINDIEEALLIYQIENLAFKITPDKIVEVLETGIPNVNQNLNGENFSTSDIAFDIKEAYTVLYNDYIKDKKKSLDEIHNTIEYKVFSTKLRYMYAAVNDTFDASVGYPWVTYLFTGMTPQEVKDLAEASNDYWMSYPDFKKVTWTSPAEKPGKSGVLSVSYKTKLNITKEVKDLYHKLMANGIEVYVCSASFIDVIKLTASNRKYGIELKEENVYAMRLKLDKDGRYINQYDDNYFQTQGKGKTETIKKFIQPKHNGAGPVLVGGDSGGDYNMLVDFSDLKVGLIFNRCKGGNIKTLSDKAIQDKGKKDAKYILQGRNENTGELIPSQGSIFLGDDKETLSK